MYNLFLNFFPDTEDTDTWDVSVDQRIFFRELAYEDALKCFFAMYFVFDIKVPKKATNTLSFFFKDCAAHKDTKPAPKAANFSSKLAQFGWAKLSIVNLKWL